MKKKNLKLLRKEDGISLVEVVATIVLISIILISFFGIIIQSNKTAKSSSDIVNATYIAQTELEEIYKMTKTKITDDSKIGEIIIEDLSKNLSNSYKYINEESDPTNNKFFFTKKINTTTEINLIAEVNSDRKYIVHIYIEVYINNTKKSSMENAYRWGDIFWNLWDFYFYVIIKDWH